MHIIALSDYERLALREFGAVTISRVYHGFDIGDEALVGEPFNVVVTDMQRNGSEYAYTLRAVRAEVA